MLSPAAAAVSHALATLLLTALRGTDRFLCSKCWLTGDILVFLTGRDEIDTACEMLYDRLKKQFKGESVSLAL